jgi:hypothetical protein
MLDSKFTIKKNLQDWLVSLPFQIDCTIQSDRYNDFSEDEIKQRIRILLFNLKKEYLINKFSKLPNSEQIRSFGFIEYDTEGDRHAHILISFPECLRNKHSHFSRKRSPLRNQMIIRNFRLWDGIKNPNESELGRFINQSWVSIPSMKPDGKFRKIKPLFLRMIDEERIEKICRYNSKQIDPRNWDSIF